MTDQIRCHYDILSVPRDADAAAVKKAHRKAALKHHPDKTINKPEEERNESATEFKLIQAAYECLSDPLERKWYDEHRDMILRGGMDGNGGAEDGDGSSFIYDVTPFHNAGCYDGYDDDGPSSFYAAYNEVFSQIFQGEQDGYLSEGYIDTEKMTNYHLSEVHFGDSTSNWDDILSFYNTWEGFTSCLSYAWVDVYHLNDIREAPSRRVRRLMEDDNRKKRKAAKKERIEDVAALLRFVKRRDPRVKVQREKALREQALKEADRKREALQKKKDHSLAMEEWRAEAERTMAEQEAADLNAGRVRLADLDGDDDYDYGGFGRKKKGRRKGKGKGGRNNAMENEDDGKDEMVDLENTETIEDQDTTTKDENDAIHDDDEMELDNNASSLAVGDTHEEEINADADVEHDDDEQELDNNASVGDTNEEEINADANVEDDLCNGLNDVDVMSYDSSSEESSEEEPDSWRCECCRKDFKSQKQFENHVRSKKHKESLKKYEKKLAEKKALEDMMDEIDDEASYEE
eukprot:CAMPEP_0172308358 /NCGR_PEP_ID=MMETSP1058-20130122/8975_1 /TAXON_ID=83371 /ORGANISM="Detonula confervacea, Strain CCMP 353" /LENGTH=518 /DNA_ID=CAMNT_0013020751 /DNA_START=40 /DNA_END=1596 /DNA_ORIENTATION=+